MDAYPPDAILPRTEEGCTPSLQSITDSILNCLCGSVIASRPIHDHRHHTYRLIQEKPTPNPQPIYTNKQARTTEKRASDENTAARIVAILRTTKNTGTKLREELEGHHGPVGAAGWSEWLAENIFHALRSMLGDKLDGDETKWAVALTDAYHV